MFTIVHNFKIKFPKMLPGFTVFVIPELKTTIRRNRLVEDCSVLLFLSDIFIDRLIQSYPSCFGTKRNDKFISF